MAHGVFPDIRRRFLQERRQTGLGSLKSTNLPFSRWYKIIFASFRNNVTLIAYYDDTPFWISAGTNKHDIEWHWMPDST